MFKRVVQSAQQPSIAANTARKGVAIFAGRRERIVTLFASLDNSTDKASREAIGDVITWDTPLISEDDKWPIRKKYRSRSMYSSNKDFSET